MIGESGSILAEWALDRDDRGKIASMEIAKRAGCQLEPYESLLECVRTVDAKALIEAYQEYRVCNFYVQNRMVLYIYNTSRRRTL